MILNNHENVLVIGTHSGIFHCDEIVATAILSLLYETEQEIKVLRSRDIKYLKDNCNILVDIGGEEFDHHQKGGNGKRINGISYASAGLVWKAFGKSLIMKKYGNIFDDNEINNIFNMMDENIIQKVDMEDNGVSNIVHDFSFINKFLPTWVDDNPDYDIEFMKVLNITKDILDSNIKNVVATYLGRKDFVNRVNNVLYRYKNMLIIPTQTYPWVDMSIEYNEISEDKIDFVVFPYPSGGFAIQCVPPSFENKFGQRIRLPKAWAGETKNLSKLSGVESAILCHKGLFFARAETLSDILLMGDIATYNNLLNKENNDMTRSR